MMKIRKQMNKHLAGDKNSKKVGCHTKYRYESRWLLPMKISLRLRGELKALSFKGKSS